MTLILLEIEIVYSYKIYINITLNLSIFLQKHKINHIIKI